MTDAILALNCGSSSVKFAVFDIELCERYRGQVENIARDQVPQLVIDHDRSESIPSGYTSHAEIIHWIVVELIPRLSDTVVAAGHRVVHGGTEFSQPVVITPDVRGRISDMIALAPSHQPHNLAGIDAVNTAMPGATAVACFDTAFHRSIPEHRQIMALPQKFTRQGLRRFGFHGLACESILSRFSDVTGVTCGVRQVVCHLGNGCSVTGIEQGRSRSNTMGFTPLDGLVMGRRPGHLDPGAVLWLIKEHHGDVDAVDRLFNQESGLKGVSDLSSDMRVLLNSDSKNARLAISMFVDRLVQEIGSTVAALGGVDQLIFSGGIGENAAPIRAAVLSHLEWIGFQTDPQANTHNASTITTVNSNPSAHVIPADEEFVIARATAELWRTATGASSSV